MRDRLPGIALAAALLAILAYVAAAGLRARGIAGLFPAVVGLVGGLAALANLVQALRGRNPQPADGMPGSAWLAGLSFGVPVIYAVLLWLLGFWVASAATLLALPPLLGYRRPLVVLAVALGTLFAIEAVFVQVFDMTLPRGLVFERLLDEGAD